MGTTPIKSIFSSWFSKKEIKLLMIGLDAAGKTTILYQLKLGEIAYTIPTIGFNIETVEYKNIKITAWDIGGADRIRMPWRHYFNGAQGIIFVVDASDKDRIEIVKEELMRLMQEDELKDAALLVLANKSDIAIMSNEELTQFLDLKSLKRNWFIQRTCALTGDGLHDGLNWFSKLFQKSK